MKTDIVRALVNHDGYISGQALSEKLGVSRAAVWKYIKALRGDGAVIEAHTNRGYLLKSLPDVLKPEYVNAYVPNGAYNIRWLSEADSTNDEAKRWAQQGASDLSVVVAEHQTDGKGRLSRQWDSQAGVSVEMTIVFRPDISPQKAPAINFAAALGVCRAVEEVCGVEPGIKWPNDVVCGGRKLCGILTEMTADMDHIEFAVCGMGVNVNQESFPDEIAHRAISLYQLTGKRTERIKLCEAEIRHVAAYYKKLIGQGMDGLRDEYMERSAILGEHVRVEMGKQSFEGECVGFAEDGAIIVKIDGRETTFNAGEVSVRGGHGYV